MAAATSVVIAGLAIAAIGTTVAIVQQQRAAAAQKKSAQEQKNQAKAQARRQVRTEIRKARIAAGQARNTAAQVGAGGSSGLAGGQASVFSQAGANIGSIVETDNSNDKIFGFQTKAAKAESIGAIGAGVAKIGSSIATSGFGTPAGAAVPEFQPSPFTGIRPGR